MTGRRSRGLRTLLAMGHRSDPRRWWVYVACIVVWQAMPLVGALLVRRLVDAVLADDATMATTTALALGATGAVTFVAARARSRTVHVLIEKSTELYDRELIRLATAIPGVAHLEHPAYLDRLEQLRYQPQALGLNGLQSTVTVWGSVQAVLIVGVLLTVNPVLLLLPVLAAPSLWLIRRAEGARQRAFEAGSAARRHASAYFDLATTPRQADEVRTLRVRHDLLARHDEAWDRADAAMTRVEARAAVAATVGRILFAASYLVAVAVVVERGVRGQATVGDVVLTVVVAGLLNQQVGVILDSVGRVLTALAMVDRFLWLVDHAAEAAGPPATAAVPTRLDDGITLEQVSFRYQPDSPDVLHGVTLRLPAGAVVAVVGDNGAGKTTLAKLLSLMYQPGQGRILVDGTPLAALDPEAWRARTTAAFQDFARLELTLQESVGVGDLPQRDDPAAVLDALDRAGSDGLAPGLPAGLATSLGPSFDDGVALSGGQWQQVALGRMMMRPDPLLVLLDEPTASLDPTAEHQLFTRYAQHARTLARRSGTITVLVSHRFSTVRMADLIVVMGGRGPVETGTHDELVALGGVYAELYALQAAAYR